jgi:HTH-type transcriptional regulator/antitoxin HipB
MLLRTPIDLGSAIRDRRRRLNLDQEDLAKQVGVSRKWIIDVEKGKPRAEIGLILRTLEVLGVRMSLNANEMMPEETATPAVPMADIDKIIERARDKPV